MMPFGTKDIAVLVIAAVLFIGGWTGRGWYEDSKDLAANTAIEESRVLMRDLANDISTKTETAIGGIRIENRTIYNQATKEIVRDVVYRDCVLPDDGVRRANQARRGTSTGKPEAQMPSAATPPR